MITLGPISIDFRFRPRAPRVPPARPNPAIVRTPVPDYRRQIHILTLEVARMSAFSDRLAALTKSNVDLAASIASLEGRNKALVDSGVPTPDDLAALDAAVAANVAAKARIDALDPLGAPAPAAPAAPAPAPDVPAVAPPA